jgi:hypothetical protein
MTQANDFSDDLFGGCLCKAVRYRITTPPQSTRLCWCRVCQYLAAGNATVNVVVPSNAVTVSGELREYRSVADSGNVMFRRFCPTCGTPIFSQAQVRPHQIIVRAGTLDEPNRVTPSSIIWTQSAPDWACFDSSLRQLPGQPAPT